MLGTRYCGISRSMSVFIKHAFGNLFVVKVKMSAGVHDACPTVDQPGYSLLWYRKRYVSFHETWSTVDQLRTFLCCITTLITMQVLMTLMHDACPSLRLHSNKSNYTYRDNVSKKPYIRLNRCKWNYWSEAARVSARSRLKVILTVILKIESH